MSTICVTTDLDFLIACSTTKAITVDELSHYFDQMSAWCRETLAENTWHFSQLIKVKDWTGNEMIFARTAVFSNCEDAVAFRLKFSSTTNEN